MRRFRKPDVDIKPLRRLRAGVWAIGHRGFPKVAPENTLPSFEAAMEAGADMVEFDVTLSRDRVPVVIHDRTLDRTTNGRGKVQRWQAARLAELDAGRWFSRRFEGVGIPTLGEVLDTLGGRVAVNVEIKVEAVGDRLRGGIEEKVVAALEARKMTKQAVISSFHPLAIRRVKRLASKLPTALLFARPMKKEPRETAGLTWADAIHLPLPGLTEKVVKKAREAGFPTRVYTVNRVGEMRKLIEWGVDGIFTDHLDRLRTLLKNIEMER